MKLIVAVLSESPLYFTMSLPERYRLVKRLLTGRERRGAPSFDLSRYASKVEKFLEIRQR
jgi:hypothetical protein